MGAECIGGISIKRNYITMGNSSHEHEIELLCQSNNGKILYCRHCHSIQIEFGNLVRSFASDHFLDLIACLKTDAGRFINYDDENMDRPIVFCFPMSDAFYCFSKKEWEEFNTLLLESNGLLKMKLYLLKEGLLK